MSSPAPESTSQPKVVVVDEESPSCEFSRWPLREEPLATTVVFFVTVLVSTGIGYLGGSIWLGIAAAAALAVSLGRMWLPVEFQLSAL